MRVELRPILDGFVAKHSTAFVYDVRFAAVAALHSFRRIGLVQGARGCVTAGAGTARHRFVTVEITNRGNIKGLRIAILNEYEAVVMSSLIVGNRSRY